MNDHDQALLDSFLAGDIVEIRNGQMERRMAGLLPPGMRCSALWYSTQRGLPLDIDSLLALGLTAARMARWEGLEPWQVPEGPYWVHMWPERIWDAASNGPLARWWNQGDSRLG